MQYLPSGSIAHLHVIYEIWNGDGDGAWVEMLLPQ